MDFKSLGLSAKLLATLAVENYTTPYPIQMEAIPPILAGRDVLGIAKTGSGKTAAYALPILHMLEKKRLEKSRDIQALVLVPTRELAEQVKEVFRTFSRDLANPVPVMAAYGGISINPQMKGLYGVQVLIATPGRLIELIESNALNLTTVKTLVLDEADKLLNLGFRDELESILSILSKYRQNLLFSATLSDDLHSITQVLLSDPVVLKVIEAETTPKLINQVGYFVEDEDKGPLLRHLLQEKDIQQVLIFTSSTHKADAVADKLRKHDIDARAMHSKKSQGARTDALTKFKGGNLRVLVATDLMSRGIDIEFLPYVINYELPRSPKDFIHRIGRTGRAESQGEAITFVTEEDKHHFRVIQKKMGQWVTMIESSALDIAK